jgi:glycosyltransferase 2 family protein
MHPKVDASAPPRFPSWLRLVGPGVAFMLLWRIDLREVGASLADARRQPLILSLFLVAPLFLVKAWRWRLLLSACGRRISLREALWLCTIAAGAASLTPGAIGDFWKGLSPIVGRRSVGLWASAIDRLYDLALLVLLGSGICVAWLQGRESKALGAALLAATVLVLWTARRRVLDLASLLLPRFPQAASALHQSAPAAAAATILAAIVALVRFQLLVAALALPLRWPQSVVAFVLTSGVAALPLSVAGLGTRDVALLGYLRACGIPSADAIALSSLCLLLFVWNGAIAACLWLLQPPHPATT